MTMSTADWENQRAHYASAMLRTQHTPVIGLDGDLIVRLVNPAFCDLFKVSREETEGCRLYDLGNGQWDIADLRRLLEGVLADQTEVHDYRVEHTFESIGRRIMRINAVRLERDGEAHHILMSILDTTDRERLRQELEAKKEYAEKIVDSVREGLLVLTPDLTICNANESFYETFKVSPSETLNCKLSELGNGQWNIPELLEALADILPRERILDDFEVTHDFEDLGHRVMVINARRLDHMNRVLLAVRDVTEQSKARAYQDTLVSELRHRIKNTIAAVRGLSEQTMRGCDDLDSFRDAFHGRLDMLARTQDLLTRQDETADLHDLLGLELRALGAEDGVHYALEGPRLQLDKRIAEAVSLAVHELATNAVKHGALKSDQGRLTISWSTKDRHGVTWLALRWQERGVVILDPPESKGFGLRIIETVLPYSINGKCNVTFDPDGIICDLTVPLSDLTLSPSASRDRAGR